MARKSKFALRISSAVLTSAALVAFSACARSRPAPKGPVVSVALKALSGVGAAIDVAATADTTFVLATSPQGNQAAVEAMGAATWNWTHRRPSGSRYVGGTVTANDERVCWALDHADDRGRVAADITCVDGQTGTPLWQHTLTSSAYLTLRDIAIDEAGLVTAAGAFAGVFASRGYKLYADGLSDAIVLSFAPNGQVRWAKRFGGTGGDEATGVSAMSGGSVALAGHFAGDAQFSQTTLESFDGTLDVAVWQLDGEGRVSWARALGGPGTESAAGVVATDGEIRVLATFERELLFANAAVQSAGGSDVLVARFDAAGTPLSATGFGTDAADLALSLSPRAFCAAEQGGSYCAEPRDDGLRRFTSAKEPESLRAIATTSSSWIAVKTSGYGDDARVSLVRGSL